MSTEKKRLQGGILIWLAVGALVIALSASRALWSIEQSSWDWRLRSVARASSHDPRVKIITIDQASLEYVSKEMGLAWPWPRSVYTPVLEFLRAAGAKGVAFDLLFTEPSNEVGDDESFAKAVGAALPVVNAVALQRSRSMESDGALRLFQERQGAAIDVIKSYLLGSSQPRYSGAALPIEPLLRMSASLGSVTAAADEDQIVRHARPGAYLDETPILTLAFALYATVNGRSGGGEPLARLLNTDGEFLIRYFGPASTYDTYSLSAVLSSAIRLSEGKDAKVSPSEFKDSYVFVGGSAPGLLDLRAVPFDGAYPGVEINATILDNLIHHSFLRHVPDMVVAPVALVVLALSTVAGLSLRRGGLIAQGLLVAGWLAACFVVAHLGWWLPMIDTALGMVGIGIATGVLQYQIEGRQHRFIRNAFRYYLSSEVIEQIVKDPASLRLGGERRELTILFSDIQGFTSISEKLSADQLVQFLNRFLSEMSTIILESGGTLDKYQGDAVIAFWNAPLLLPNHRQRAVAAALRCQARLREIAPEFEKSFGIKVKMRIGLNTGIVSVGNFGSAQRFNYTMIGDAANVASRLEGVNKVFGTSIIVSESAKDDQVEGVVWRRVGRVKVVGRSEPIAIYEPLDTRVDGALVTSLPVYHDAVKLFEEQKFEDAREKFAGLSGDPVSNAYVERIGRILSSGRDESAVWDVKEK